MFQVQKEAFKLTLKKKLDFEKDSFFSYLLLNSRADLISKAYEITLKTAIYNRLYDQLPKLTAKQSDRLLLTDHIVDYIYLKKKNDLELQKGEITSYSWNRVMKDLLF